MGEIKDEPIFIKDRFGAALRKKRRSQGYSSTKKLSDAIKDKTGVYINFDVLNRIERGERPVSLENLLAISYTLGDGNWETEICSLISDSMNGLAAIECYRRRTDALMDRLASPSLLVGIAWGDGFDPRCLSGESLDDVLRELDAIIEGLEDIQHSLKGVYVHDDSATKELDGLKADVRRLHANAVLCRDDADRYIDYIANLKPCYL